MITRVMKFLGRNHTPRKDLYDPPLFERYIISKDKFSQERLAALLHTYKVLKAEVPFFAGMMLYGSLTKGKILTQETAQYADIDFVLFLDHDSYERNFDRFHAQNKDFQIEYDDVINHPPLDTSQLDSSKVTELNKTIAGEKYVQRKARQIMGQQINGITAGPVAEFINLEGKLSIYRNLELAMEGKDPTNGFIIPGKRWFAGTGPPFMLDIGGGLLPYRKAFFERLSKDPPEKADRIWKVADESIRRWERKTFINIELEKHYPQNAKDAMKYYAGGGASITK